MVTFNHLSVNRSSLFSIVLIFVFINCTNPKTVVSFEKSEIDLGNINPDKSFEVIFEPQNIGKNDLIIERVISDCHCTVARNYSKKIKPDKKGVIKIIYHSKGLGYFEQLIEVFTNTDKESNLLIIKGKVLAKKQ